MDVDTVRIGLIGPGRLGTALGLSLARHGCGVRAVAGRNAQVASALVSRIEGCRHTSAQALADSCDLVFIATPDDAIAPTARSLRWRSGMGVVHCSGVTEVAALDKAAGDGALIGGFHPMQTFGDPEAAARSLQGCTITVEAEGPLNTLLIALVERLGCRLNQLPPGSRARYHAAAGYASQFVNVLLREACTIWQSWGATEDAALRALLPLVRGTLASIEGVGLAAGMPGPVSRGDVGSVVKHVDALADLGTPTSIFYRMMCERTITLAQERPGGIDEDTGARIRQVLEGAARGVTPAPGPGRAAVTIDP